ncbi:IclR family transcriptional regulator [Rhodobacteraceae bacterium CCMM004]|nr:IclR family transcriptional regulator [Rhodobacteraceae bacterium CCMM004]
MKDQPKAGTGTAHRVMKLLSFLADADGPVSVSMAGNALGLAPATTHRLLNLAVEEGFATYNADTATYGVGMEYYRVAARVTARVSPAVVARSTISELAARYDETVLFGLYLKKDGRIAFIERADGQRKLLYRIDMNTPLSLVWGASGKAALAFLPEADVARILEREGPSPATGQTPPEATALFAELRRIREKGYCVSHGEKLPGALGIAAPVFGPGGVLGTLCMTMPRERAPEVSTDELGREVAQAARDLTDRFEGRRS